jgi:Spy/CpxP family protein refolding chaperone
MQPLINLKTFLAVLLLLIVPGSLLVAYFRNYSSEAPAHEHGEKAKNHGAVIDKGDMSAMKPSDVHAHAAKDDHSSAVPDAQPGTTSASHLYHIGATGFFLDHSQHITLSIEQQQALNQIKEQAAMVKASACRSTQDAEQNLWTLTAADQPDSALIEASITEIEKRKSAARLRFINAIGAAAKILTEDQRGMLTRVAPPASTALIRGAKTP